MLAVSFQVTANLLEVSLRAVEELKKEIIKEGNKKIRLWGILTPILAQFCRVSCTAAALCAGHSLPENMWEKKHNSPGNEALHLSLGLLDHHQ